MPKLEDVEKTLRMCGYGLRLAASLKSDPKNIIAVMGELSSMFKELVARKE